MKFINIGFGNMVAAHRVVTIVNLDSSPIKRMVQDAKEEGRVIDVTCGRRTRSVIVTDQRTYNIVRSTDGNNRRTS